MKFRLPIRLICLLIALASGVPTIVSGSMPESVTNDLFVSVSGNTIDSPISGYDNVVADGIISGDFIFSSSWYGNSVIIEQNGKVLFEGNQAPCIRLSGTNLEIADNGEVVFEDNHSGYYGVIHMYHRPYDVSIIDNRLARFSRNEGQMSTIYCAEELIVNLNDELIFEDNSGVSSGGCISAYDVELCNNDTVNFLRNSTGSKGGAVAVLNSWSGEPLGGALMKGNGAISFEENSAQDGGGAICASFIEIVDNTGSVSFCDNRAVCGGALYGSEVTITGNVTGIEFCRNVAEDSGGAIYMESHADVIVSNNGAVIFSDNSSSAYGGAICMREYGSIITMSDNTNLIFSGNSASYGGGAISVRIDNSNKIKIRSNSSVVFRDNRVSSFSSSGGGAIEGSYIELVDNGSVSFSGNGASGVDSASGGAIWCEGGLDICNNDSVEFYQNYVNTGGTYRLQSINSPYSYGDVVFSAAAGKKITFRDSIFIDGGTLNLNANFIKSDTNIFEQKGDIIFTGKSTEDDLYIVKGNVAGTSEEILASRTTEVNTMTNLYGGRLCVEDRAIYMGQGVTAHAGSGATVLVKNATLSHSGYDLTFNAGTTLELAGLNSITGNVQMLEGSTLRFVYGGCEASRLTGSLRFEGTVTLQVSGYGSGVHELLMLDGSSMSGWDALSFTNGAGEGIDASRFAMIGDSLFYKNGETMNLTWTNAAGDGLWNNKSLNWSADGTEYAMSILQNVIFASGGNETITMVGIQSANTMTVQQGGQYVFFEAAGGASLHVEDTLRVEAGAAADLQLAGGVQVSGALESAGALKVNKLTGKGIVNITGGSVELADDVDALAVDGRVSINHAELRGIWTGVGLSIGCSSVAAGASVTLKDVTLTSTLSNAGNLVLGGLVTVMSENLDFSGSVIRYSAGESGFAYQENTYSLVTGEGSTGALAGTQWAVQNDATLPANATYSYVNGVLHAVGTQDKTQYWVNGAVTYDGRSEFSTASTLVLNGGNLSVNTNLGSNLTGGIRVDAAGTLTLGSGVQLNRDDINGESTSRVVTLQGNGQLNLGSSADFAGYSLGKDWTGAIQLANISVDTNLIMNKIGRGGSTIELENVMGYTGVNAGTVDANLVLKKSYGSNGAEQAAFRVSNGYSNSSSSYVMTTFSGAVCGDGKIVFDKTLSSAYTGFAFTGNVAGWTGAFELNAGKTFNLVFGGSATEINAAIRDVSTSSTLNLVLQADSAMRVNGDVVTDSISVSNSRDVSFYGAVNTGSLTAVGSNVSMASVAEVSGDMTVGALHLQAGGSLDVGGTLSVDKITMDTLSASTPALTVGQFGAADTVFLLDVETLNALNLGHGESVTIVRADQAVGGDFSAWLTSVGSTSLDAAVYRYDISVENTDVVVTMDYANWGSRVWYGNTWEGFEDWSDYVVCGYDAVDGVETVNLDGAEYEGMYLLVAPGKSAAATVFSNGSLIFENAEIADSRVEIASDAKVEVYGNLDAAGKEVTLHGTLALCDAQIGSLSGTNGTLSIDDEGVVSIGSDVTLGKLQNNGTLDVGKNKLNVAGAITSAGNVIAGEVEVHNRSNNVAKFDTLVADKVTVTNTLSSYADAISLGDGSAVGELYADKLTVRSGTVELGYADKATAQQLESLELQKDSTLVLNQQTSLKVTDALSSTEDARVQLKQDAALQYGVLNISNRGAADMAELTAAGLVDNSATVRNAHVSVNSSNDISVDLQLENSSIENAGSGKVMVTNPNAGVSSLYATGGDIDVLYRDATLHIEELVLGNNTTVAVYTGAELAPTQQGAIWVDSMVEFGENTQVNASLTINAGAELKMAEAVSLSSGLSLGTGMTLAGEMLTTLQEAELGSTVTLFTGIESLNLLGQEFLSLTLNGAMEASIFFSNVQDADDRFYYMVYDCPTPGAGVLSIQISEVSVPEPTTTTLSLLALMALAVRRRRK